MLDHPHLIQRVRCVFEKFTTSTTVPRLWSNLPIRPDQVAKQMAQLRAECSRRPLLTKEGAMLIAATESEERITTRTAPSLPTSMSGNRRLARFATSGKHSTAYRLVERAALLAGRATESKSSTMILENRAHRVTRAMAFQRLIAEIGSGKAGLVLRLDASRLARNNRDWHQLLNCAPCSEPYRDGERLYDPGVYHDRLLLGLSGIMSESRTASDQVRLHQGERQRLRAASFACLCRRSRYQPGGGIILIRMRRSGSLRLVFAKFRETAGARASCALSASRLAFAGSPATRAGAACDRMAGASSSRVIQILKNPAYAGRVCIWRRRQDPSQRKPGAGLPERGGFQSKIGRLPARRLYRLHRLGRVYGNQERLSDNLCAIKKASAASRARARLFCKAS